MELSSAPVPPFVPPPPPQKKSLTWPILILITLFLLVAVGILAYRYYQPKAQTAIPTSPELTAEQKAALGPTADWQTYTNDVYGFIIKYPQDINAMKENISRSQEEKPLYVIRNNYLADNSEKYAVQVAVWDNPNKSNLMDWMQYMKDSQALNFPSSDYKFSINYQVNAIEAIKFWENPIPKVKKPGMCSEDCPTTDIYFVKGDKTFRVQVILYMEVDENISKLPDQIIATLKFTD